MRFAQPIAATAVLALVVCAYSIFSQTSYYYITGSVSYENGSPVSGATVSLIGQQKSVTTGPTGIFDLSGYFTAKAAQWNRNNVLSKPELTNGVLHFAVPSQGEKVKIELFNMNGKCIAAIANTIVAPGSYSIPVNNQRLANQVCVLKVAIGSFAHLFRLPMLKAMQVSTSCIDQGTASPTALSKKAAFLDTVMASAAGSPSQKKVIDSLICGLIFVLQNPAGSGGGADASLASLPLVMPVLQSQYSRFGTYYTTVAQAVAYTPVFNPESLNYAVSFNSNVIVGIKPRAAAAGSKISVKLDNAPSEMVPWWYTSYYVLDGFYSCTLSTPGQKRTFATAVTAADNVSKRTYSISMIR